MVYLIEFACTGNNGRSPLAETIGFDQAHTEYKDLFRPTQKIDVVSSGTKAEEIFNNTHPLEGKLWLMEKTLNYKGGELLFSEERKAIEEILGMEEAEITEQYNENIEFRIKFQQCSNIILKEASKEEQRHRNNYLSKRGLEATGQYNKQTIANKNTAIVLGVKDENTEVVKEIYSKAGIEPFAGIHTLTDYADMDELPDAFLRDNDEEVMELYSQIEEASRKSIDKFVEDNYETLTRD